MAKLNLIFDVRRVSKKTGEAPLKIAVSHRTQTAYIPLGISLLPEQWDAEKNVVNKNHPRRKTLNDEIDKKMRLSNNQS